MSPRRRTAAERNRAWLLVQRARLFGDHIRSWPEVEPGEVDALLRVERSA